MTRVLEFVVALIIVFILAVIVGLFLPSHAHIQRSIEISHNPRQIYDVLNNFGRFQDYVGGELQLQDPQVKFTQSGPAYGPGATISWAGNGTSLGDGKLVNKSGNIDISNTSTVAWTITNDWRGENKTFTLQVTPRADQRVSKLTWGYDVDYGWNLIDRYSQLWIHGAPATMIQYGLDSLQNMMAGIPNVDYSKVEPGLYRTNATPVLLVSTKATRTLDDIDTAKDAALKQIEAVMDKLGVKAAGPTTTVTTNWGDTTYTFDLAVPIDATTLTIDGKQHDLTQLPPAPTPEELSAKPASSASAAKASSAASSSSAAKASSAASASTAASSSSAGQPASGSSAGAAGKKPIPGNLDEKNQLIVNADVRARMVPAHEVLEATWTGEAGVPLVRLALKAYAGTHGYQFDENANRLYDQLASPPGTADSDQVYRVFLPVQGAPAQTPDQISGRTKPLSALDPSLWSGNAKPAETKKAASGRKKKTKPQARKRHHRR
ncbi:MAG TPA: polyketide cyclase [Rhodanobacteraceae bacterium]|nr:polyketide cyclase [Rhodanobacteraceae bacterium]